MSSAEATSPPFACLAVSDRVDGLLAGGFVETTGPAERPTEEERSFTVSEAATYFWAACCWDSDSFESELEAQPMAGKASSAHAKCRGRYIIFGRNDRSGHTNGCLVAQVAVVAEVVRL